MNLLAAAYTVLAVAAGARAAVQLATASLAVPYALSAVAALAALARTGRLGVGAAVD